MTNPSFHPPRSAGEPRTPVGEGGDTGAPAVVLAHDPCTYENYTRGARAALAALRGQESGS